MKNKIVLALMQLKGISRKNILKYFVLEANMDCTTENIIELVKKARLESGKIQNFSNIDIENAIKKADEIIENSEKNNIKIITYLDDEYPYRLKNITDPPVVLYYKGDIRCLNEKKTVAIIGTREPIEYGMKIARNLGASFGKRDYVVVSGLALGCDSGGHEGCLDENGKTIAVMPCGLEKVYPAKNKQLAQKILENGGGLISEYPPYSNIFKNYFVDRDRLQSGLSDGVLVVETGEKGGTLHTVEYTLEYGRVLACFNHPKKYLAEPKTFGNQKLIKEGKALSVSDDTDLEKFRKRMEENQVEKIEVRGTQSTIFDFIHN